MADDKYRVLYAYARADGEELVEFMFGSDSTEKGAKDQAADFCSDTFDSGTGLGFTRLPEMVVYRMVPIAVGTPKITPGLPLDDVPGDKEPDEFDGLEWVAIEEGEKR